MKNRFYKLRFIPTGEFYKPSTGYSWQKNNLSPTGKVYTKKAIHFSTVSRIDILSKQLPDRENLSTKSHYKVVKTTPNDWEWVEFEIIELEISPINEK